MSNIEDEDFKKNLTQKKIKKTSGISKRIRLDKH